MNIGAARRKRVERNIHAVEIAVIGATVLKVIDDLQRRAQGVGRGPGRPVFPVHIEHIAPDGHRGPGAILDEVIPIPITQFGDVLLERPQ